LVSRLAPKRKTDPDLAKHEFGDPDYGMFEGYQQQSIEDIPNYDKLTRTERWLMNKLPGIAESNVGKALAKFSESWAGKALQYLDIGAEGVERLGGLGWQYHQARNDPDQLDWLNKNLKHAWAAGSLTSDVMNMPIYRDGRWQIPTDLPGISGLVEARRNLSRGLDLETVRSEYLNGLGALALRAQKQDALQHIIADPLWIIGKYVKPLELIKEATFAKTVYKALPDELVPLLETNKRMLGILDDVADVRGLKKLLKTADEADIEHIEKLIRLSGDIPTKEKMVEYIQEISSGLEKMERLTPAEQKILQMTGAFPELDKPLEELGRWQKLLRRFNPFSLTSSARASEMMANMMQNYAARVLAITDDPQEMVRVISRLADGFSDPRFGHAIVTPQGRMFKGLLEQVRANMNDALGAYDDMGRLERPLLGILETALGDTAGSIYKQIVDGEEMQVYDRLMKSLDALPDLKVQFEELLRVNGITDFGAGNIGLLGKIIQVDLADAGLFKGKILNDFIDATAQAAILRFGVKQQGFIEQVADSMRKAESLAFLKMNPAYPIKNLINNVATSVARGNYGLTTVKHIERFWDEVLGFIPPRATEAFTPAELARKTIAKTEEALIAARGMEAGRKALNDVVRVKKGWLNKFDSMIDSVGIGTNKWTFGTLAQEIERSASMRAYYNGYTKYHRQMARVGKGYTGVRDFNPMLADQMGDDAIRAAETAIEQAFNEKQLNDLLYKSDNIALNGRNIVKQVEEQTGTDITNIIGEDTLVQIEGRIATAAKKGRQALRDEMSQIELQIRRHIEDLSDNYFETMIAETEGLLKEGPGAFPKIWNSVIDEQYNTHTRHAMDTNRIISEIKKGTDPGIVNARWRKYLDEQARYYARFWKRQRKRIQTVSKLSDAPEAKKLVDNFDLWEKEWKKFFTKRNRLWNNYHEARLAKTKPPNTPEEIRSILKDGYSAAASKEDELTRGMDDFIVDMMPAEQQDIYRLARSRVADLRKRDREFVSSFYDDMTGLSADEVEAAYQEFWQQRMVNYSDLHLEEQAGLAAVQGSQKGTEKIVLGIDPDQHSETLNGMSDIINELRRKMGKEEADVGARAAERAEELLAKAEEPLEEVAREAPEELATYLDDFHGLVPKELAYGPGMDELLYRRTQPVLEALEESAWDIAQRKAVKFGDFSPETQKGIQSYTRHIEGQMSDIRLASMKMGEWQRDASLLNYNRRYNYDTWLGTIVPYEFWTTHTAYNWMLHTFNRPHATAFFLRMKKFLDTGMRPETGFPSRLKGHIRINVPFLEKVMGDWIGNDVFVNPMHAAIPVEQFARPFDEYASQQNRDVGMAERVLEELMNDNKITHEQYIDAMQAHSGPTWDRAVALARQDDTEERLNGVDLASMVLSPHAPLMWAYNASQGKEFQEGPFLPISRSIRGIAGLFGVDINDMPVLGIGGKIRESLGLHPFDAWDDYRINRMMVNMLATEEVINGVPVTVDEVKRAMIEKEGPLYDEAKVRAMKEFGIGAMGSITGIPIKAYPVGEEKVREKRDLYEKMWQQYEAGNHEAYGEFMEAHPDYEARLALFKPPEEQLRSFVVDQIWDTYNDLPNLDRREVREQLGDDFVNAVLNKETRSTDSLPVEMLSVWLKAMGGDPPGSLGEEAVPINFAPPEVSQAAQFFYDFRNQRFPNYFEQQQEYYRLDEGRARHTYRNVTHPELGEYFAWKWDFLTRNPTVAPYLSENPPTYASPQELQEAFAGEPRIDPQEVMAALGNATYNQIVDFLVDGDPLDSFADDKVNEVADRAGLTEGDIFNMVAQSVGLANVVE
jgi:hypothetical protein